MVALVPAKCTECGGNININPEERLSICEYCGRPFVVQEAIQNFNTAYNITTNISNDADSLTPIVESMVDDDTDSICIDDPRLKWNDKAVTDRRMKEGETIRFADLTDPAIFQDLVISGLIELSDEVLCVRDVIGRQIKNRVEVLTPLKAEMLV